MPRLVATCLLVAVAALPLLAAPRVTARSKPAAAALTLPADWTGVPLLVPPRGGTRTLRILCPSLLELEWISATTSPPRQEAADPQAGLTGQPPWPLRRAEDVPSSTCFEVKVGPQGATVRRVGFARRVIYAPLRRYDLRVRTALYLEIDSAVPEGAVVTVQVKAGKESCHFRTRAARSRWSPCIHVNQEGYQPDLRKVGIVGFYLGTLGELSLPPTPEFRVVEAATGQAAWRGRLVRHPDRGSNFATPPYQQVFHADFTSWKKPGTYRLEVPGLGSSFPFVIHPGIAAGLARTWALGLYHQRCGAAVGLPYSTCAHAACHLAPAQVPTPGFARVQGNLGGWARQRPPGQKAPPLHRLEAALYPFQATGRVDIRGGHHDAGDYSKYTINSAQFIHFLAFAADNFPGAGDLDNLGLPDSGDGRSDLLQVARWEAEFLARMQDSDGGFYFLAYPRDRPYEDNVPPDRGDPQVVYPKNTSATAAAVAALAQLATSPRFRRQFPRDASRYLACARQGWKFLEDAWARHGQWGAYQRLTHYGDVFADRDETAWAATEMYLATGDERIHELLRREYPPAHPATRRWGWWRLFESYGAAARSYAFAARSGRVPESRLHAGHLAACRSEIVAAAHDVVDWSRSSAYGTAYPLPSKRFRTAGWYFSTAQAFDLAVAWHFEPRQEFLDAFVSNLDFDAGANPNDVCFVTGLGWRRPLEIVSQWAQNRDRFLPPAGIPEGSLQTSFGWVGRYGRRLSALTLPSDSDPNAPWPMADRWADAFNVTTECVSATQARGLAALSWLMARTPAARQPWKCARARIAGLPSQAAAGSVLTATLIIDAPFDLRPARITWEVSGRRLPPARSDRFTFQVAPGPQQIDAEAQGSDGRRASATFRLTGIPGVACATRGRDRTGRANSVARCSR